MQDSNTSRMTHNVYELIEYATNILTLSPGDIISGGSPAGTNIELPMPAELFEHARVAVG